MALSANTVWEVRTGGNDTNGGGFVTGASGTDYSQQNANNTVGNNISTTDAVANGTTTITSATASFTSAIVGNIIYLSGGTGTIAAQRRQVTAFTNSTTITIDASIASSTGMTMNIGGAAATPGGLLGAPVSGNIIYCKYNATPITLTTATANTPGGPLVLASTTTATYQIGYDTTRTVLNTDTNRPTIKAGANSTTLLTLGAASARGNIGRNFILDANGFTGCTGVSDVGVDREFCENVKALSCATGFSGSGGTTFINCESSGHTTAGFNSGNCFGCIAHGGTAVGFTSATCINCISYSNTGAGVSGFVASAFSSQFFNCTSYGNGNAGFDLSPTSGEASHGWGLLSYGNSGAGFACGNQTVLSYCAAGSNTSGNTTGSPMQIVTLVALTANPFTNAAGGDFSLNNTAGGGAACRAAGFPGVFPGGTTTGHLDIGAVQHQDSGGGGATVGFAFSG